MAVLCHWQENFQLSDRLFALKLSFVAVFDKKKNKTNDSHQLQLQSVFFKSISSERGLSVYTAVFVAGIDRV